MKMQHVADWFERHSIEDPTIHAYVGKGWIPILDVLAEELKELGWDGTGLCQIKEKYGGLRFYLNEFRQEWEDVVRVAEQASFRTCEDCGAPGSHKDLGYWWKTWCDSCFAKWSEGE